MTGPLGQIVVLLGEQALVVLPKLRRQLNYGMAST